MQKIQFDSEVCRNLERSSRLEWLETNGLGGFACGTVAGMNTRRYHGYLTAALNPPVGRAVLLSKVEETLVVDGERFELSANRYPGTVHPKGFSRLESFTLDPFPVWVYQCGEARLEKTLFLVYGTNTLVLEYRLKSSGEAQLELRPQLAFRDYHALSHKNDYFDGRIGSRPKLVSIQPYSGMPVLHFGHNAESLQPTGDWYLKFEYDVEKERGLDFQEDLFQPFLLTYKLREDTTAELICSTVPIIEAGSLREKEVVRRAAVVRSAPSPDPFVSSLVAAADQFLVGRKDFETVIAGYPWFSDWGRDTMISLPGLTLVTGRFETAREILLAFAEQLSQGMLPNRFADEGEPEYNTVDATLWFVEGVRDLTARTGDLAFVKSKLYESLREIFEWHMRGTRYGIRADTDGLLLAGAPGIQLTWMDARVGDRVITPRSGKAVEIQALWYNALRTIATMAKACGDPTTSRTATDVANLAARNFEPTFWYEEGGYLFDVVSAEGSDTSLRPNQVFAASLRYSMLSADKAKQMLEVVRRELLTPAGLRTLSRNHPDYKPRYRGDGAERDEAYHQGTVWPWLMGPFVSAWLKVHDSSEQARAQAESWLRGFEPQLREAGLGQLSEVADAEPPHTPGGCFAQAWSVAEVLRSLCDDVLHVTR